MLVGRTEGYLIGNTDINATVERLKAYSQAGADVLYVPGGEAGVTGVAQAAGKFATYYCAG